MRTIAACALACLASPAWGELPAGEFRHRAPIQAAPGQSHYRLSLPAAVYMGLEQAGLGDLRVLNASGEAVPHAFVPRSPVGPAPTQTDSVRLFPLHGEAAAGLDGVKLDVVRGKSGTVIRLAADAKGGKARRKLLGYLVDAGESDLPMEALLLDWRTGAGFNGTARIEASDDLSRWATVVPGAPVLALEHDGQRLERKRVEVPGHKARYLRISFAHVPENFTLLGVKLERRLVRGEPAREWRRLAGTPVAGHPGEFRFDAGGRFPVDRLRLHLPQANTVAQVQWLARDGDDAIWRNKAAAAVFRLERNGVPATSPDVAVAPGAERQWLLKVDQRGGGLGAGEVVLEVGWVPHELVFAARGSAPFALAYGSRRAKPEALQLATVLPEYRPGKEIEAPVAKLGQSVGTPRPEISLSDPLGLLRALVESGEGKKWALWALLIVGVLAVAWMALRLLREVGPGRTPPGGPDRG